MTVSDDDRLGRDQRTAATYFLSGCVQAGLRRLLISPGSRSTPLVTAAAVVDGLRWALHLDERSAAFAALGEAKLSGEPVAVVCTSGTAAANYLPAIAEANMSDVPLLILTADRPPEHVGWGVGQSFDQRGLYGRQVRAEFQMPVGGDGGLDHAIRAGIRATATAADASGPIHVNWPFRLPLEPTTSTSRPPPTLGAPTRRPAVAASSSISRLTAAVRSSERPLIVAGPGAVRAGPDGPGDIESVVSFARRIRAPIITDLLSGIRGAADDLIVDSGAHVVAHGTVEPDLVIRLGDTPTAKNIRLWWEHVPDARHVLLDPNRRWHDPSHVSTEMFHDSIAPLLDGVDDTPSRADADWCSGLVDAGRRARRVLDDLLDTWPAVSEAHVARAIGEVASDATVFASSSMPVRDLDTFTSSHSPLRAWANRGINGIDGVIATAIGAHRARPDLRLIVHIGDVAVLHDIGSLLDAARQEIDMTIVVPNNDGGGIFSFLPIRQALEADTFTTLFHTPHATTFEALAGFDGIDHRFADRDQIQAALDDAGGRPGIQIVEVPLTTADHLELHAECHRRVAEELS